MAARGAIARQRVRHIHVRVTAAAREHDVADERQRWYARGPAGPPKVRAGPSPGPPPTTSTCRPTRTTRGPAAARCGGAASASSSDDDAEASSGASPSDSESDDDAGASAGMRGRRRAGGGPSSESDDDEAEARSGTLSVSEAASGRVFLVRRRGSSAGDGASSSSRGSSARGASSCGSLGGRSCSRSSRNVPRRAPSRSMTFVVQQFWGECCEGTPWAAKLAAQGDGRDRRR